MKPIILIILALMIPLIGAGRAQQYDPYCPRVVTVSYFVPPYNEYDVFGSNGENYRYVLVEVCGNEYVWTERRMPQIKQKTLDMLIEDALERGYIVSVGDWNEQTIIYKWR